MSTKKMCHIFFYHTKEAKKKTINVEQQIINL